MKRSLLLIAAATIAAPQIAWAETPTDQAWLDAGVFRAHINSHLRLGNEKLGIQGTDVDFEKDLGLDSNKWMPKATAGVRFLKRFRLEGDYFQLNRDGHIDLTHNLTIDDTVFPLSADIDTHFRTNIYRVAVGYSFVRQDRAELGVSLGAHVTSAKFQIEALNSALEEHRSKSAPLPNVGLYGSLVLWGPIVLQGNIDAFKVKVGKYKGTLLDGQIALNYRIVKNLGVGAGYRYAHYKIQARTSSWDGTLWYTYSGPTAYLEVAI
jgi:hypothetical protein